MADLSKISAYFLILELNENGEAGLLPEIEPIELKTLFDELQRRTGHEFGDDIGAWTSWFLGSDTCGSEQDRANLLIYLRTRKSMEEIWQRLGSQGKV